LNLDTLIPAIGQEIDIDFANASQLATKNEEYETRLPNIFIGGDALRGASTAINAIGDGRKAAQEIIDKANIDFDTKKDISRTQQDVKLLMINKTKRKQPQKVYETELNDRQNFKLVTKVLTKEETMKEASRCLLCDEVCNICTTVCPNLAFHSYEIQPVSYNTQKIALTNGVIEIAEHKEFKIEQKIK